MCGILGGVNTSFDQGGLARLQHRGPDQQSLVIEQVADRFSIALGQTRLNIVDRHDIDLPVRVGRAAVLFNGEIYNWRALRAELESLGQSFQTQTDTEVVLVAYLQWGHACLERFNGMFGIAIWDGDRFFCARDRMGKKPLFYRLRGSQFEFASEIKAFQDLEFTGNDVFDLFEFCPGEHTLYRGVYSIKPGEYLTYDPSKGTLETRPYWDIPHRSGKQHMEPADAVDRFLELLDDAVKLRMQADVPVTMFLSGGIDSSLVARLAGLTEAFTCQFEEFKESIDEESYAADLAHRLGIELHVIRPTRDEFMADLSRLAYYLEMPTGSFSVFPLYRLAKAAHGAGYKVVLSGEGSDELFAGYARNEFLMWQPRDPDDPRVRSYRAMLARFDGGGLDRFCRMASRSGLAGAALMKGYLTHLWSDTRSVLDNVGYIESRVFLQALLQMADRMCMAHSIESRCPFLDHRIVDFAFSLDDSLKVREGQGKWLVWEAARRVLPKGSLVLGRQVKHGLATPVNLWMQGRHSFDRKYWNALMTAECMKTVPRPLPTSAATT